jgi:hypothetical protein
MTPSTAKLKPPIFKTLAAFLVDLRAALEFLFRRRFAFGFFSHLLTPLSGQQEG